MKPIKSTTACNRIDSLSGIKICLQLWIIALHLYPKKSHYWFGQLPANCPSALTAFFMLSGFCNELSYGNVEKVTYNSASGGYTKTSTKLNLINYYIRRYFAFFPVYWLSLAVSMAVAIKMKGLGFRFSHLISRQFLSVFTMTWTWYSKSNKFITWSYNGAIWYMSTISFLWFVYPVLRYLLSKVTKNHIQTTITMIFSLLLSLLPATYLVCREEQIPPFYGGNAFGYWYVNPWLRLPHFWLGMVLCKAYKTNYLICDLSQYTDVDCTPCLIDQTTLVVQPATDMGVSENEEYNNFQTPVKQKNESVIASRLMKISIICIYTLVNIISGVGVIYIHGFLPQLFETGLQQSTFIWFGTAPLFVVFIYTCLIPHCRYSPFVNMLSAPVCSALIPGGTIGFVYIFQTPSHYLMGGDFYAKVLLIWVVALTCNHHIFTPLDTYIKSKVVAKTVVNTEILNEAEANKRMTYV